MPSHHHCSGTFPSIHQTNQTNATQRNAIQFNFHNGSYELKTRIDAKHQTTTKVPTDTHTQTHTKQINRSLPNQQQLLHFELTR